MPAITASAVPEQGVEVPLRGVEGELSRQLRVMHGEGNAPVNRVRMSTLVVFTDRPETAPELMAELSEVVTVHPARVLLLVGGAAVAGLTAAVRVLAHRLGNRDQACSELVVLRAPPGGEQRLPFAVRGLLVSDLPVNLWWASPTPPPLAGPAMADLADEVQQVMYDSLGWLEPATGVAAIAGWIERMERSERGRWRVVSDLNWRRLKYWRRFVAQALDGVEARGDSDAVTELRIEHGPHAVVQAWELAGWLARRLNWKPQAGRVQRGVEMAWKFRTPRGNVTVRIHRLDQGPPEIRRVRIVGVVVDQPVALNLSVEDSCRLSLVVEGADAEPRTLTVPALSPAEVVGRQLSDRERDPVFRESMTMAQAMAQGLVG